MKSLQSTCHTQPVSEPGARQAFKSNATKKKRSSSPGAHQQAMLLVQQERLLRHLLRSLPWTGLTTLDRKRLARATDALESDVLLARILLRAAAAKTGEQSEQLHRRRQLYEQTREDDEV